MSETPDIVDDGPKQARPREVLEREIMDSRIPKNDREWWAKAEIERLRDAVTVLGKAYSIHTELHQITHVCGYQPTCPACDWERDALAARDAVKFNPTALAALNPPA